jgi:23S rRNA (adenine2503-C2)-methyltransferase
MIFCDASVMPCTLAWSLHSADDKKRNKLVPSTRYTIVQPRDGLKKALKSRKSIRIRNIMIALTQIDGINDTEEDAMKLTDFI